MSWSRLFCLPLSLLAACNSPGVTSSSNAGGHGGDSLSTSTVSTAGAPQGGGGNAQGGASSQDAGVDGPEPFEGYDPPVPGEYKPKGGPCEPCDDVHSSCNSDTGFCCHGYWKDSACRCGAELGCQPPAVCCALPGELDYKCAPSDECPQTFP